MFLHGGLMHLLGNMLYLWIFGKNIEDIFFIRMVVVPAKYVLIFWFVIQAFQGVASLSTRVTGGVAGRF